MNILILGGTGMAGHTIASYLDNVGYNITTFNRKNKLSNLPTIYGDVTNPKDLEAIKSFKFDYIINAIGLLNEDAEYNKSDAVIINSFLPHFLSEKNMAQKIIQLSTDCVFSGERGNYSENDLTDGNTFYDKSKALGELKNNKDLTIRTSIIGPDISSEGKGLFNWFMEQKQEVNGYNNVYWTGVTTLTLAKAISQAIEQNLSGLYHLVNNEKISKFALLEIFNKTFKNNEISVNKFENKFIDKSLINNRKDFNFIVPSYEEMVEEMKEWIINNKELYPHYNIL